MLSLLSQSEPYQLMFCSKISNHLPSNFLHHSGICLKVCRSCTKSPVKKVEGCLILDGVIKCSVK